MSASKQSVMTSNYIFALWIDVTNHFKSVPANRAIQCGLIGASDFSLKTAGMFTKLITLPLIVFVVTADQIDMLPISAAILSCRGDDPWCHV